MIDTGMPDLVVGLIRTRDAVDRPRQESIGILPNVVEVTASVANVGDSLADQTVTSFWVHGAGVERELRIVDTPELLPGDEVEVTALWDLCDGSGDFVLIVMADAFSQLDERRKDNNSAMARVVVSDGRVELV